MVVRGTLFFNNIIETKYLQSASLQASLREVGCTELGHLMNAMAMSTDALARKSNITSIRLIKRVVKEVCAALPQTLRAFAEDVSLCDQWSKGCKYIYPLSLSPQTWWSGRKEVVSCYRSKHPSWTSVRLRVNKQSVPKF